MLITFTSKYNPDIVMFQEVASPLLRAMGESDQPPGILRGENIKQALAKLEKYLQDAEKVSAEKKSVAENADTNGQDEDDEEDGKSKIGLRSRALPLLEMLEKAYREEVDVIWR